MIGIENGKNKLEVIVSSAITQHIPKKITALYEIVH